MFTLRLYIVWEMCVAIFMLCLHIMLEMSVYNYVMVCLYIVWLI